MNPGEQHRLELAEAIRIGGPLYAVRLCDSAPCISPYHEMRYPSITPRTGYKPTRPRAPQPCQAAAAQIS